MAPSTLRSRRGSALSLAIIVSVVLTGMVLALAWVASLHVDLGARIPKVDAAFYAAQAGLNHGIWKFRHDNQWNRSTRGGSISYF